MQKIKLSEAHKLLKDCEAVIFDGTIVSPVINDIIGDDVNNFLYLTYDVDGLVYEVYFEEGNNPEVKVDNSFIYLKDIEGEEVCLTPLFPRNLENFVSEEKNDEFIQKHPELEGSESMDDIVSDCAENLASEVNNNGVRSQVQFLLENGWY